MILRSIFLSSSLIALAACGGSSSGTSDFVDDVDFPEDVVADFDDVLDDFKASSVLASFDDDTAVAVPFSELSAAGSATYSGEAIVYSSVSDLVIDDVESVDELPSPTLVGSVALQTSFSGDEGTLTGSISDFVDSSGNSKNGELTISDGDIYQDAFDDEANFEATIDGTLSGSGAGNGRYQGFVFGGFVGDGVFGTAAGLPITQTADIADLDEDDFDLSDDLFAIIFAAD